MKVGDSVRPKHDLYKRGIGVIVNIEPAIVLPGGHVCGAIYHLLFPSGVREVSSELALEKV